MSRKINLGQASDKLLIYNSLGSANSTFSREALSKKDKPPNKHHPYINKMARRRVKKRTHVGASNGPANKQTSNSASRSPKSMVIRIGAGEVGPSVSQLVKDVRLMMEPDTAARLKERRANKLRDYITMAGPLGVTHLLLFSRSPTGNTNMRLALTPRGPTLHFKVERYSLCKDVKKAMKRPKGSGKEYHSPPLV